VKEDTVVAASVSNNVPPVDAVYQRKVPELAEEALKLTTPGSQREPGVTVGILGVLKIVAVTALRALTHVPLSNST
jgi:hypothetical protein